MSVCVGSLGSELYRYLCSKQTHTYAETYYNITKGAHFLLLSTKERREKKNIKHTADVIFVFRVITCF